jgi:hypothetical protein
MGTHITRIVAPDGTVLREEVEGIRFLLEEGMNAFDREAEWIARMAPLKKRIEQLEAALEFYAQPETYFAIAFVGDPPCGEFLDDFEETELGEKPGKRARAALLAAEQETP